MALNTQTTNHYQNILSQSTDLNDREELLAGIKYAHTDGRNQMIQSPDELRQLGKTALGRTQAPTRGRTLADVVSDTGVSLAKGVAGTVDAGIGLADIVSGGYAGKFVENNLGIKTGELNAALDQMYSDPQKAAKQKLSEAKGFWGTVNAAVENPSTILQSVVESAPSMVAGGLAGRGLAAIVSRVAPTAMKALGASAPIVAGAAGEGIVQAGSMAEQVRQQNESGLLTGSQAAQSVASGIGTGAFNLVGGKIAQKLGIGDIDTVLAGGKFAAKDSKNVALRIIEGGISEGMFEELPQSMQEQVWMNAATGRDLGEGVAEAGAAGMLTGAAMGGGANIFTSRTDIKNNPPTAEQYFKDIESSFTPEELKALQDETTQHQEKEALIQSKFKSADNAIANATSKDEKDAAFKMQEEAKAEQKYWTDETARFEEGIKTRWADHKLDLAMKEDPEGTLTKFVENPDLLAQLPKGTQEKFMNLLSEDIPKEDLVTKLLEKNQQEFDYAPYTNNEPFEAVDNEFAALDPEQQEIIIQRETSALALMKRANEMRRPETPQERETAIRLKSFESRIEKHLDNIQEIKLKNEETEIPIISGPTAEQIIITDQGRDYPKKYDPFDKITQRLGGKVFPRPKDINPESVIDQYGQNTQESTDIRKLNKEPYKNKAWIETKIAEQKNPGNYEIIRTPEGYFGRLTDEAYKKIVQNNQVKETLSKEPAVVDPEINLNPTEKQKESGRYKKATLKVDGLEIAVENPNGSIRNGKDEEGNEWSSEMNGHYGYFKRTKGKDGDQVDVVVKPGITESPKVFVVDQVDPKTGKFDEHKVILGVDSKEEASQLYNSNYESGWKGEGAITELSQPEFKLWLKDGKRTTKPLAIKTDGALNKVKEHVITRSQEEQQIPKISDQQIDIKSLEKQRDDLFSYAKNLTGKDKANALQEVINLSGQIEKQRNKFEIRDTPVATHIGLEQIQKLYPKQQITIQDDNSYSVKLSNGKGINISKITNLGDGYISFALNTGQMTAKGKILGVTEGTNIKVDANYADNRTLWHENKHVLDNMGLISLEENSMLISEFNKLLKNGQLDFQLSTHENTSKRLEENIANTFAQIMTQREEYRSKPLGKLIQKVMDFFKGLLSIGQQTVESFAKSIESGDLYNRTTSNDGYKSFSTQLEVRDLTKPEQIISDEEYDRVHKQTTNLITQAKQLLRRGKTESKLFADKLTGSISTRLRNINPMLSAKVRQLDFDTTRKIAQQLTVALPVMHNVEKMSANDKSAWDWATKNSDSGKLAQLLDKYNMRESYTELRKTLDQIRRDAIDVGYDVGNIDEYWPRVLKDQEGFLQATKEISQRPIFTDALREQADKMGTTIAAMDKDLKADIISNIILGNQNGIGGPGNIQGRVFDVIPEEYAKFYMDSKAALMQYIYSMNKKIEARRFFGKVPEKVSRAKTNLRALQTRFNKYQELAALSQSEGTPAEAFQSKMLDISQDMKQYQETIEKYKTQRDFSENIGSYIAELLAKEQIQPSDERTVKEILEARFHERGTTGIVNAYKNFAYIDTMGSPLSALTQIGDLAWSYYVGGLTPTGIMRTTKNIVKAAMNNSTITKEDLGIERIAQEFANSDSLSNAVSWVFRTVGLEKMDSIGKESLINTSYENYKAKAQQNPEKLKKEIRHIFGKETNSVVNDLLGDNPTDNVKLLVYNRLLDFQPVALSEMPEKYLNSGNGRIFYMLKTYTLKHMDVFRREVFQKFISGDSQQVIEGLKSLISMGFLLTFANAGADQLKDWILGKDSTFEDNVVENLLTLGGASRVMRMQVRNEGAGSALGDQIIPPFKFVDSISKDAFSDTSQGLRSIDSIPIVGKLYYWHFGRGADNRPSQMEQEFKELKSNSKKFKDKLSSADDKRSFLMANIDDLRQAKRVDHYQGILNKNKALINKLKKLEQTPNVRKRISQLEQRRVDILQQFFKTS